jgi:hypothetical protein
MEWHGSLWFCYFKKCLFFVVLLNSVFAKGDYLMKAHIFKMPDFVEPSSVTTAGHYILAYHIVRSLTKLDKYGKIQSDIAIKWHNSDDRRTWTLTIGKSQFSNGEFITATDVAETIKRQVKFGSGVHFNFKEIKGVKVQGSDSVIIELENPRNDFIYDLSKPEFGVLYKNDYKSEKNAAKFEISSGAYALQSHSGHHYKLKRNQYFLNDIGNKFDLEISDSEGDASYKALKNGEIDFFTSQQNLTFALHEEALKNGKIKAVKPHIGFSFWLAVNPHSTYFRGTQNRATFQSYVKAFTSSEFREHTWEKAAQLYLPDGDGRPSESDLAEVWKKIEDQAKSNASVVGTKEKLRVLPLKMTNSLLDSLLKYLSRKYDVEVVPYSSEDQLQSIIKSGAFELKISSNDFSSTDLSENLKTTFNASRPYVFLDSKSPVHELMKEVIHTDDPKVKAESYKKIALSLLSTGLIAPVGYQRIWFYHNNNLDISSWSNLYPEISFWKVKVNDH